ncbi:ComEC/Rec2 family competence protein [Hymenobacter sp.]|uniref:ComEC/Rec2 family competence protein n=1 Tax=Hymenobacter sp. TaxID=1898978 RepID=UPI002ED9DFA2
MYDRPGGTAIQDLLWGDYLGDVLETDGEWSRVEARGPDGWIKTDQMQDNRILEVNFIDVGQGDGCFIVTPDDRYLLIDAGQYANMERFLTWRFNLRYHEQTIKPFEYAIISHPDEDHYRGFAPLFTNERFRFETVCHNGIIERAGDDMLGLKVEHEGQAYLAEVVDTDAELRQLVDQDSMRGGKRYPNMLYQARQTNRVDAFRMVSTDGTSAFLPGYDPVNGDSIAIQILAPVHETLPGSDRKVLRDFGRPGVTKNGHSVVLKLTFGKVRILLGGDLNTKSEAYLLAHYTGLNPLSEDPAEIVRLVAKGREFFEADIAKACHHGSHEFLDVFLRCVNPLATIVSSGDGEPHAHPRPDALGALGKNGRGQRPLIFSTELARSAREGIDKPEKLVALINELEDAIRTATEPAVRAQRQQEKAAAYRLLERSIAVYGMINVRTDGERVIIAQKLEKPGSGGRKYDIHQLELVEGVLQYVP